MSITAKSIHGFNIGRLPMSILPILHRLCWTSSYRGNLNLSIILNRIMMESNRTSDSIIHNLATLFDIDGKMRGSSWKEFRTIFHICKVL